MEYLYKPHFYAHILSTFVLLISVILLAINYKKLFKQDGLEIVKILSVLAIAIAAYGNSNTILDKEYGYNPLSGLLK